LKPKLLLLNKALAFYINESAIILIYITKYLIVQTMFPSMIFILSPTP